MQIEKLFAALVPPLKGRDTGEVLCTELPLAGDLFETVRRVFSKAPKECDVPVVFQTNDKQHAVRDLLLEFCRTADIETTRRLFSKLAAVTSRVPGVSLCFAVHAMSSDNDEAVFLSRFPAAEAIRTTIKSDDFEVQMVKDIFMRSSRAYKAAYFVDSSITAGFWEGAVVDKQINDTKREVSEYWIYDFLEAELHITSASGTAMFANALRSAIESTEDMHEKQQMFSVATLLANRGGQHLSMKQVCEDIGLATNTRELIKNQLEAATAFDKPFKFDTAEYRKHAVFKSVYLENGAILTAETYRFQDCFDEEIINAAEQAYRYSTFGKVADVKVRRRG